MLDQDQMNRLANVLQSAQGTGILDDVIVRPEDAEDGGVTEPEAALVDLLSDGPSGVGVLDDVNLSFRSKDENDEEEEDAKRDDEEEEENVKKKSPPKRRSQRQAEREIKEEAERIRQENQVIKSLYSLNHLL